MTDQNDLQIDAERLWQRHIEMAEIGGTPGGGVHRLALGEEDITAHRVLADWALARNFTIELDAIGNMFIRRDGLDPSLPPATSGSHTDTQPFGGRFDGISGVLTAYEALETIDTAGIETRRAIETIIWNNEEGSRFIPACMGSAVYAGAEPLDEMRARTDADGVTMGSCVDRLRETIPEAGERVLGAPLGSFVEAHIEQGPELEANENVIGVVTGMQGYRRFEVTVTGEDAHSGTTPRSRRKDAFVAATDMAVALRQEITDQDDVLRFTIGRFEVLPGGISVVPGKVRFFIDIRHPSAETLLDLGDRVAPICDANKGPCEVEVDCFINQDPLEFSPKVITAIERAAADRGYPQQPIYSCAGHDARHASKLCPSGMIFVPCWKGISHNEAESAEPEHLAAAAQVITDLLVRQANET